MVGWGPVEWPGAYGIVDRALYEAKAEGQGRVVMGPMIGSEVSGR